MATKQPKKKSTKKTEEPKVEEPSVVIFQSREPEPSQFSIRDNKATRLGDGRIQWEFSEEEAVLVRRHTFVSSGRVVEV
jgi:hypothetical protein